MFLLTIGLISASENYSDSSSFGYFDVDEGSFGEDTYNSSMNFFESFKSPELTLEHYKKDGNHYANLSWASKDGRTYEVLRKDNDSFNVIATVNADSSQMSFYDKIDENSSYAYTVREVIDEDNGKKSYDYYDPDGLKLLNSPDVDVDFQNLKANISWSKLEDATNYYIFRKVGYNGEFKCIGVADSSDSNYVDYYYNSANELSSILNTNTFIDSSFNNLFYTVKAVNINDDNGVMKASYSSYLEDGDFNLEAPSIVSLDKNEIRWGKVPNAEGYLIIEKSAKKWKIIGKANQTKSTVISAPINNTDNNSYYSVRAYAIKNGKTVYSDYDKGFSLMNYSKDNAKNRILYIGDSITYGSPYKSSSSRHIFSIPHRVSQLTGCVYYNPSIPGSTYHDLGHICGMNILNTNNYRYRICREVVDPISVGELPGNWMELDTSKNSEGISNTSIDDYNIVVLAAGTNDYLDNSKLGPENSNDTSTFNGAFNHIIDKIENASKMRVEKGESPIKVVFVDLYYSDRVHNIQEIENRDVTPNDINLTLKDYQKALDKQYNKWQNKSKVLTFYKFKTRSYNIVNEKTCPYMSSDNLHFTKFTYGQYGNVFAQFLVDNVFENETEIQS